MIRVFASRLRQKLLEPSRSPFPCVLEEISRGVDLGAFVGMQAPDAQAVSHRPGGVLVGRFGVYAADRADARKELQGRLGHGVYVIQARAAAGDDDAGRQEPIPADLAEMRLDELEDVRRPRGHDLLELLPRER